MQAPPESRPGQGTLLSRLHCRLYTHKSTIESGAMVCQSNRVAWHKARSESDSRPCVALQCQTSPQIRKCPLLAFQFLIVGCLAMQLRTVANRLRTRIKLTSKYSNPHAWAFHPEVKSAIMIAQSRQWTQCEINTLLMIG